MAFSHDQIHVYDCTVIEIGQWHPPKTRKWTQAFGTTACSDRRLRAIWPSCFASICIMQVWVYTVLDYMYKYSHRIHIKVLAQQMHHSGVLYNAVWLYPDWKHNGSQYMNVYKKTCYDILASIGRWTLKIEILKDFRNVIGSYSISVHPGTLNHFKTILHRTDVDRKVKGPFQLTLIYCCLSVKDW